MSKEKIIAERANVKVCEYKCLYVEDVYHEICEDCQRILKVFLGWRLTMLIMSRINNEQGNLEYTNGVRFGLMEASGIIQGLNEKYWF